ncbi:MAG: hypothetical protein HW375_638 [Anaerolineales bacterium]|nr:hypothetical protein [Anaerolineales bacterium]
MAESLPSPFAPSRLPASADSPDLSGAGAEILEALLQPRISLFWGAQAPTRSLLTAATTIAAGGLPVRLFDGGNSFDGYFVARLARRLALASARPPAEPARRPPDRASHSASHPGGDPYDILDRMHLSRAFTCFQLAELIENAPAGPEPLFVLDLLATFYDESVPLRDSERLLATTLTHLRRLAAVGPVVVGGREPQTLVKERWLLLDQLQAAADAAWMLRPPPAEPVLQPRLF